MVFPTNPSEASAEISSSMKALTDMLFHAPLTDETKIQFLKEELSAGRYHVQSHSLAEKLMEHVHLVQQPIAEEIF
jgi:anti-sigma28 factor (negative regulator of flagellin synthesis)